MAGSQKQEGGDGSTNYLAGRDLHTGATPEQMQALGSSFAEAVIERMPRAAVDPLSSMASSLVSVSGASVVYAAATPLLDPPPPVERLSSRSGTVRKLVTESNGRPWIALDGPVGAGKSQLALLLGREFGGVLGWIGIPRDASERDAVLRLDLSIARLADPATRSFGPPGYAAALAMHANSGLVLVVDDLPRLQSTDLVGRVVALAEGCGSHGLRLVTTSHYGPPRSVLDVYGRMVSVQPATPLQEDEVEDVLLAFGASTAAVHGLARFVAALTGGHPMLAAAAARYLAERGWQVSDTELDRLFRHEFSRELLPDVVARLLTTVTDSGSRELLYRLELVVGSFTDEELRVVCSAEPRIERPQEKLASLTGIWIQKTGSDRMSVSPLVKGLSSSELSTEVSRNVYRALGEAVYGRKVLDDSAAALGITYLASGHAFDQAGIHLSMVLRKATTSNLQDAKRRHSLLLHMWSDSQLPSGMDAGVRLFVRATQIRTFARIGQDHEFALQDFIRLAEDSATPESVWGLLVGMVESVHLIAEPYPEKALGILRKLLEFWPARTGPRGVAFPPMPELDEALIGKAPWLFAPALKTCEHILAWLDAVTLLNEGQLRSLGEEGIALEGCRVLGRYPWMTEHQKPEADRNWTAVLDGLEAIGARARDIGLGLLEAWAVAGRVVVLAEYCKNLVGAVEVGARFLESGADLDPISRYVVGECVGRQFAYFGDPASAISWLEGAVNEATDAYPDDHVVSFVNLSMAVAATDLAEASCWTERAVAIALGQETHVVVRLQALGEHAISLWFEGRQVDAVQTIIRAIELAHSVDSPGALVKEMTVKLMHVASSWPGEIDGHSREAMGGFAPVRRGFFLSADPKTAELYSTDLVAPLVSGLAERVGLREVATDWAVRGLSEDEPTLTGTAVLAPLVALHLVENHRFGEALQVALRGGAARAAQEKIDREFPGTDLLHVKRPVEAILGLRTNPEWKTADMYAIRLAAIPALFVLARMQLEGATIEADLADLVEALRWRGTESATPELWHDLAALIEDARSNAIGYADLVQRGNTAHTEGRTELHVTAYLLASLADDVPLDGACTGHLMMQAWTKNALPAVVYQGPITRFVETFWTQRIERTPFLFSTPQLVKRFLADAIEMSVATRCRAILEAVAVGLRVSVRP